MHVVLGAAGGAGHAIMDALAAAGLPARAVVRRHVPEFAPGVEVRRADVADPSSVAEAVAGASVVYLAAQPPYHRWPQEFPAMLETVIGATARVGAKLVMVDNLYAYGSTAGPMTEATPQSATDAKGRTRAAMADRLLRAHRDGELRVAIGRASDYFGPHAGNSSITALAIEPALAGRTLRWLGSLDVPHAAAYLPDVARGYVALGTRDDADGQVWILPHAPAVTGREFLGLVNENLPVALRTAVVSRGMLRLAAPFHRISRETLPLLYQWTEPYLVDDSHFQRVLGPVPATPLDRAVAQTLAG